MTQFKDRETSCARSLCRYVVLLTLAGLLILSCGDDLVGPTGDKTPPTVVSVTPANGTLQIDIDTTIRALFSEQLDTFSVTSVSFVLDPVTTGTFSFDSAVVEFTPSDQLLHETSYTVTIATQVTDLAGNRLAQPFTWSFSTELDPASVPPVVTSISPSSGATNVDIATSVFAVFSKGMDATTLTATSFALDNGAAGTVTYANDTATLTPTEPLAYSTVYTVTIDTSVADTFGTKLAAVNTWSFTTLPDPMIPIANIAWPPDDAIIGDTVTIVATASHPVGIARIEFCVDGAHIPDADDSTAPYEYLWDASAADVGSAHTIHAKAYDSAGREGSSSAATIHYLWEELATDAADPWETDLYRVLARSTDSLLELRFETYEDWYDPYDTVPDDTTLDLGIYFDTDRNAYTGRDYFGVQPYHVSLNNTGAEYRAIIGAHGIDAFAQHYTQGDTFHVLYDPTGFAYLNLPPDTNVLEVGIEWIDLGEPSSLNMVCINVLLVDTMGSVLPDWVPDQGQGYLTIYRQDRFIGEGYSPEETRYEWPHRRPILRANPFGRGLSGNRR